MTSQKWFFWNYGFYSIVQNNLSEKSSHAKYCLFSALFINASDLKFCPHSYSSCVYRMMRFKGSNGKICKMMTSHFGTLLQNISKWRLVRIINITSYGLVGQDTKISCSRVQSVPRGFCLWWYLCWVAEGEEHPECNPRHTWGKYCLHLSVVVVVVVFHSCSIQFLRFLATKSSE